MSDHRAMRRRWRVQPRCPAWALFLSRITKNTASRVPAAATGPIHADPQWTQAVVPRLDAT